MSIVAEICNLHLFWLDLIREQNKLAARPFCVWSYKAVIPKETSCITDVLSPSLEYRFVFLGLYSKWNPLFKIEKCKRPLCMNLKAV